MSPCIQTDGSEVRAIFKLIPGKKDFPAVTVKVFAPRPIVILLALVSDTSFKFIASATALHSIANAGSAPRNASAKAENVEGVALLGGVGNAVIAMSILLM